MKFVDLFAGIGGFRRGMELAGHECVGFCEFDKYAVASYTAMHLLKDEQREHIQSIEMPAKKNGDPNFRSRQKEILKEEYRNGEWYADDIRAVDASGMPRSDCWCFGFPCQDISIAGNRLGFAGYRSSLFFAVTKLIRDTPEEDRPNYLLIENVKNLLSVNGGFDFAKLLVELDEIGYDAEWEVLNSKNFGVPQNRERVFIIGHFRGRGTRKVFPLEQTDSVHNETGEDEQIHEAAQCLTAGGNDKWQGDYIVKQIGNLKPDDGFKNKQTGRIYDPDGISPTLNACQGGGNEPKIAISMTRKSCKEINIAHTLTAGTPDKKRGNYSPVTGVAIPVLTPDRMEKRQKGRRFKENGEPMFTLTSQDRHGVAVSGVYTNTSEKFTRKPMEGLSRCLKSEKHDAGVYDGIRIRKLTPRECFRLQGWADEYFDRAALVNSDSQLYKQAGNGVTVNVIQAIGERMK